MNDNKPWLQPDWPAPANIHAAATLRTGGISNGQYASLNMAMHVGDYPEAVTSNRELIKSKLQLPSEPKWLNQVHSNLAVEAGPGLINIEADASYSNKANTVCVVMTADCLPILLCSRDGDEIAAIHAGWRGLVNGIVDNTVKRLQSRKLIAWLGPAIGPDSFEVGEEVVNAYLQKSKAYQVGFRSISQTKWLADIYKLAKINLNVLGIDQIYGGGFCTYKEVERFFSYRRDKETGRMATLIWRD